MTETEKEKPTIKQKKAEFKKRDLELLEAINKHGSINKAAKKLNRSYSYSQKRIRKLEKEFGKLIESSKGGKKGGGSHLTEKAHHLIKRYKKLQVEYGIASKINITTWKGKVKKVKDYFCIVKTTIGDVRATVNDELKKGDKVNILIREDSVTLIAHEDKLKKIKTSARNQFKGKIKQIKTNKDNAKIEIKIKDKIIKSIITQKSLKKMKLKKGKNIIVSFKATSARTLKT
ncbi:MAG: Molybdopterin-binding protein ModE [Candidatus Methanohalarchaeum thermophilum]|uniref:Molybdopterin-binding protein ModE n=1 Tax=Methanohalarchaeum thermophilum TaxID=1903181 RepID=A0A1Q6DWC1_METT1|nr:MAG: Molybdopterin-binding protein ModE [Candidatus Methanohalarchaeum thermophilum]